MSRYCSYCGSRSCPTVIDSVKYECPKKVKDETDKGLRPIQVTINVNMATSSSSYSASTSSSNCNSGCNYNSTNNRNYPSPLNPVYTHVGSPLNPVYTHVGSPFSTNNGISVIDPIIGYRHAAFNIPRKIQHPSYYLGEVIASNSGYNIYPHDSMYRAANSNDFFVLR